MPFMLPGQPFLYDDLSRELIGLKHPDGSETYFTRSRFVWKSGVPSSKADDDANEKTLASVDIPRGTMRADSALRVTTHWTVPSSAATKRVRARFGGVVLFNLDLTTSVAFVHQFVLQNRNSLSSQVGGPNNTASISTFGSSAIQAFNVDFATLQQLTITGQWPVAGAGANNITLEGFMVEVL
jgi:hypothetical protein